MARPTSRAREIEVLHLLAEGASNKVIARALGISAHTAKFHVASILEKLDAASRTEAVTSAIRLGLLTGLNGSHSLASVAVAGTVSSWPGLTRPSSQPAEIPLVSLDSRVKRGYDNRAFQSPITGQGARLAIKPRDIALRPST